MKVIIYSIYKESVMTDRMCFSKISVLNDFIHNLIDNGL